MSTHRPTRTRRPEGKPVSDELHTGVFVRKDNYGFIDGRDLFVRWDNINTALNKDIVEYLILENEEFTDERRFEAKIINIVKRNRVLFVGNLVFKEEGRAYVLLDNPKLNKIVSAPDCKYPIETKVVVKLTHFDSENLQGTIVKKLGGKNEPGVDVISVLEEYRVDVEFSPEVLEEAEKIELDIDKHRKDPCRRDFTRIPFVTIDPDNSQDYDDAIAVIKQGNKFRLYVAIADVWSYIRNNPKITETAAQRATSIYYLDSVIPMLPEKLCNNFCSIVPKEERCAMILEITVEPTGKALWDTIKVYPAIIRSRRRFTYGEVNEFFDGETKLEKEEPEVRESLELGLELYKLLDKQRINRGYVQLENPETKLTIDSEGKVIAFQTYIRGHAQFMIENFMVLANESIARFLTKQDLPGIFRTHDRPEPSKLATFISEVRRLNFFIRSGEETFNQKTIFRWFQDNKDHPLLDVIGTFLLRSLPKAIYSINNSGHFGLNLRNYLHFTSPIRRYPDVIVHKMLWEYVFEEKEKPKPDDNIYRELDEIAKHCTEKEIEATDVSRAIESLKVMQFLNDRLEHIFKGRIISTVKYGGYVRLEGLNIEGFVKFKEPLKLGAVVLVKPLHNNREFKIVKTL